MTLASRYQSICSELKVKANSAVVKQLPESADGFTEWDLTGNIVGTKGVVAILKLATELPELQSLNLSGNNLGSAATKDILSHMVSHPNITSIDVSGNDIRLGGPELVELLKKNKRITSLNVDNTFLRPLFVRLIAIQLKKNGANAPAQGGPFADSGNTRAAARFSFGDAADNNDSAFAAGEDEAFSAFGEKHVAFEGSQKTHGKVPRRPTVCAEVFREDEIDNFTPEVIEKDPKVKQWLMTVLERHDLFSHLEDFELSVAVDAMVEANRMKGDTIFDEEDEEEGDLFYVIGNGEVELTSKGEHVTTLTKGSCTQDLMLMYAQRFRETAVCLTDVTLYTLDRVTYKCVLSKASKKKRAMYEGFLSEVNFLKCLNHMELLQLADALKPASFEDGQTLIKYGEVGETFYLITEGVVDVYGRDDKGEVIKVCDFTAGQNVGELEFINNHKCVADVKARGFVRTAKMNRHHFEMVMGPVKEVLARTASESTVYAYYREKLEKMEKEGDEPAPDGAVQDETKKEE